MSQQQPTPQTQQQYPQPYLTQPPYQQPYQAQPQQQPQYQTQPQQQPQYQTQPQQSQQQPQQPQPVVDPKKQSGSAQILKLMKSNPYTQTLTGKQVTYSILSSNQRFLCLIGIESIGYARTFPANIQLPLKQISQLPQFKQQFTLTQIKTTKNDQQLLSIQFSDPKIKKWQFACPNKVCALNWKNKIQAAVLSFTEYNSGKFKSWQQYLKFKKQQTEKQQFDLNSNIQPYQLNSNLTGSIFSSSPQKSNINTPFNQTTPTQNNTTSPQIQSNIGLQGPQNNLNLNVSPTNINNNIQTPTFNNTISLPQVNTNLNLSGPQTTTFNGPQTTTFNGPQTATFNGPQTTTFSGPQTTTFSGPQTTTFSGPQTTTFSGPQTTTFNVPQTSKIQNLILHDTNSNNTFLGNRSLSNLTAANRQQLKNEIFRYRRNWIEQLLGGQQQIELAIQFGNYVQKIVQVIVGQIHISQQSKTFPTYEYTKQYASYLLDDVYIEIYLFSEEQFESTHLRYQNAQLEFKNLEYLLNATENQGPLRVPFMVLFEYKGFLGSAKSRIAESGHNKNRELLGILNKQAFQEDSKISVQTLLNENKNKIVSYDRKTSISKINSQQQRVFFAQKLGEFLPSESTNFNVNEHHVLRLQLLRDEQFEGIVFRDRKNQINFEQILRYLDQKIKLFVKSIENQQQYFTNSQELEQLVHFYGLNIRQLGLIYRLSIQPWIKKIIRSEIAARSVRNFFKVDLQRFALQKPKLSYEQQVDTQRKRVVSFLNVLFGNTESTLSLWKSINSYSQKFFNCTVWDKDFNDLNIPYFLQAVQSNLKITLNERIFQRRLFSSANPLEDGDFVRFEFSATIYNLDFTDSFTLIHEYIAQQTLSSFQNLCEILIKQTSSKIPYLQLLKKHPIYHRINEFLVNFTSPDDNVELYKKIQHSFLPSKVLYESKLAQIKWYLKANRVDKTEQPTRFIEEHARKWLGEIHPLFTQLNRILAEYFCDIQANYANAIRYANASLAMQQALFGGQNDKLWRDYFLIGKINYSSGRLEQGLKFLVRAKGLAKVQSPTDYQVYGELSLLLAKGYINNKYYKQAYTIVKDLYQNIKQQRDQKSIVFIAQSVTLIKQLLEINQEYDSYYRFIETDFSNIMSAFVSNNKLLLNSVKIIALPYLKGIIQKTPNRSKLLTIIEQVSKIQQTSKSSLEFIKTKISEGTFPKNYIGCLRDIESVIDEINVNQMLDRWKSFNRIADSQLLQKIGKSQINRGFEFLAVLTAIFSLLGTEAIKELFLAQK